MKKVLTLTMTLALLVMSTAINAQDKPAEANMWNVDKAHSSISFKVRHMVISKTKGSFTDFDGKVMFDSKNFEAGSADFSINVASIDTDNEDRDKHLKSPDFFDSEKFPSITFKSTKIVSKGDNMLALTGDLTIKDVTKEVTFDVEFNGTAKDPWGNNRAGFSATTKIDRTEFNMTWSKLLETGGLMVGNEVEISMELELIGS